MRPVCLAVLASALAPAAAAAQLITIRTVPVSIDEQFQIYPSQHAGMGYVSIALHDTLLDPFSNPAKAMRVRAAQFFGSPSFYHVSNGAGSGRTLPLGALGTSGPWFGGAWAALQQVDAADVVNPPIFVGVADVALRQQIVDPNGLLDGLDARTHGNQFAFATLGRVLPSGVAVGGSVAWAGLHAIDGVDLLYARSAGVKQLGTSLDVRLGALKEWRGQSFEALVLHDRYRMKHDVTYLDFVWDPGLQQTTQQTRLERNLDYTDTWGVHMQYERPLPDSAWRVGWIATMNRMSHPKIPNYEIMSIPRDPGGSYAYNLGVGFSKTKAGSTFGIDVIYEPIWSHTWADAAAPVITAVGDTIPAGGKTIENQFRFANALMRIGVAYDFGAGTSHHALQFGLSLRSISYDLTQANHVDITARRQHENWIEWTPTWGLRLGFPNLAIRYQGRLTTGTGRPGVRSNGGPDDLAAPSSGGIIVAPSGPLSLTNVQVMTHQFSISLPLR
jgi:hypothetical protein